MSAATDADDRADALRQLAGAKQRSVEQFADAIADGDADDTDFWFLVRGMAGSYDEIEAAAADGAGLDDEEPAAKAVAAAFSAIYELTVYDGADAALEELEAAVEYAERDAAESGE